MTDIIIDQCLHVYGQNNPLSRSRYLNVIIKQYINATLSEIEVRANLSRR